MTKKHFNLLADALRESKPQPELRASTKQWQRTVDHVADKLAETNDRFDRERFLNACWR